MIPALLVFQTPELPEPLNDLSLWVDLVTDTHREVHVHLAAQTHRSSQNWSRPLALRR